ncbi:MAG: type II secretion system F family protein [Pseudomonadota bacterium]
MDIISLVTDRNFQIAFLVGCASAATMLTVLEPFFAKDKLQERMKSVGNYRENLRQQQRESLAKKSSARLRTDSPQGALKDVVESLKLLEVFDEESARKKLMMAGYRGQGPVFTFMAARIGLPWVTALGVGIYVYVLGGGDLDNFSKLLATLAGFFGGFYLPNLYINNVVAKRQQKIQESWPDALDLLLICVESGMSIEAAFQKVGDEVGPNSPELAEELGLTTAELSYLQERKSAYVNLAERTGLDSVKGVATALIQSEKYGTPLGQSLRVMADESRDLRMQEAEKKAAALPPKLTVPMIGFFLPVLFAVIMGPAAMSVMGME